MTENEAVIQLNFDMEMIRFNPSTGESLTLEQIKAHNEDNYKTYLADELAITALLEIQQYRAIGTVEEFKAFKEKNEPKKVIKRLDVESRIVYYRCPNCNVIVGTDITKLHSNNCPCCGQSLKGY